MKIQFCFYMCVFCFMNTYAHSVQIEQEKCPEYFDMNINDFSNTLINFDQEYYVIGIVSNSDAIVCSDKNGYRALCFDADQFEAINIYPPKSIENLIESGWAVCLCNFQLTVLAALRESPAVQKTIETFIVNPPIPVVETDIGNLNKNLKVGHFEISPDAYLFVLMRGDYLSEIVNYHCIDCNTPPLKLKQTRLYYPLVLPLLKR